MRLSQIMLLIVTVGAGVVLFINLNSGSFPEPYDGQELKGKIVCQPVLTEQLSMTGMMEVKFVACDYQVDNSSHWRSAFFLVGTYDECMIDDKTVDVIYQKYKGVNCYLVKRKPKAATQDNS